MLGILASHSETLQRVLVLGHILAVMMLEVLQEVVDHAVIKILTTQVRIAGSRLDFKDTFHDS